jgi:hypothetical protein
MNDICVGQARAPLGIREIAYPAVSMYSKGFKGRAGGGITSNKFISFTNIASAALLTGRGRRWKKMSTTHIIILRKRSEKIK